MTVAAFFPTCNLKMKPLNFRVRMNSGGELNTLQSWAHFRFTHFSTALVVGFGEVDVVFTSNDQALTKGGAVL